MYLRGGTLPSPKPNQTTPRAKLIWGCVILALSAFLLFAAKISLPPAPLFDEPAYLQPARSLLNGTLTPLRLDSPVGRQHPPLGIYLIAIGIRTFGDNPLGWRLPSVIAGTFTLVAVFLWTWLLVRDYWLALTAASLTLFNNFLYVMSRVAMLDVFAVMFSMWGLLGFTAAFTANLTVTWRRALVVFSGISFGLAAACKWNAVDTFAVVAGVAMLLILAPRVGTSRADPVLTEATHNVGSIGTATLVLAFTVVPAVFYLAAFLPLFKATHEPFSLRAVLRLHALMLELTRNFAGNPALYAAWYTWPFRTSPLRGFAYLLGNFVVMWGGLVALAVCASRLWKRLALPEAMVLVLYAANLLQWAVTPLKVPHYYYYFSAAMFLGPAIAVALRYSPTRRVVGARVSLVVLLAAFVFFLYCYPRMANLQSPWDCMFGCWD